jgi:hypothetical protein
VTADSGLAPSTGQRAYADGRARVARLALLFILIVASAGTGWHLYLLRTAVRPERAADYLAHVVAFPAALALLAGLSLIWLRHWPVAGAVVGTAVLFYYAGSLGYSAAIAPLPEAPDGVANVTARLVMAIGSLCFAVPGVNLARQGVRWAHDRT